MRHIRQPGPPAEQRIVCVPAHGRRLRFTLAEGLPLLEAVRRGFAEAGFVSGTVRLDGLKLSPFAYVMPALSRTPEHAAYYSETFRPAGITRIECGAMTFGIRDGAPFFHAHALWSESDGKRCGGHILPDGTAVAEAIAVEAVGLDGACFAATQDAETNFKLFEPASAALLDASREGRFYALRVRPNVDFTNTIEQFCREHGIAAATIHGGVGSTIGARLADGAVVENFATEVAITSGRVGEGEGGPVAEIEVALVDYTGVLAQGRLSRGENPVLMTFELILEAG